MSEPRRTTANPWWVLVGSCTGLFVLMLDSTVVMLARKIGDKVTVVKDYDHSLPPLPAYPAELNQVWTNLIDNATPIC